MANKPGVGFIGSGFVTKFHLQAWRGVRDADVLGIYSPFRTRSDRTVNDCLYECRTGKDNTFQT